jgi:hypothetical protein
VYPKAGVAPAMVLRALIDRGVLIDRFQKAATPLEEIFVRVVQERRREARS